MKLIALIAAALCALGLSAQDHSMHQMAAPATPALTIETDLGDLHHPVSTTNAQAQAFFDQGLRYVYAFNHEAAIRSFDQAAALDPDLAMAYWGSALALGPNINMDVDPEREKAAYDKVHVALSKLDRASDEEKALILALSKRYTNDPAGDLKKLAADYRLAMRGVMRKYPDDLDVATLYAESIMNLNPWRLWMPDGTPREGTEELVSVLESVLKRNPKHVGANHYYIHAVEASKHPERATASADRIAAIAPGAGHLVHMPAHIYQRTGNYAGAAMANETAADVDRRYIGKWGVSGMYVPMYYNHNLSFGAVSRAMLGDHESAAKQIDEFGTNVAEFIKVMPAVEIAAAWPLLIRVRSNRWDDVLATKDPAAGPASTAMWHFAQGTALAVIGRPDDAVPHLKALDSATLSTDMGILQNSPKQLGAVASALLRGRIAAARGEWASAISAYKDAVKAEDGLGYDEPPDWILPAREALGAAQLRSGDAPAAEKTFRQDLVRNPNNPRSLFGLSEALKAQKKNADAAKARAQFEAEWKGVELHIDDL